MSFFFKKNKNKLLKSVSMCLFICMHKTYERKVASSMDSTTPTLIEMMIKDYQ